MSVSTAALVASPMMVFWKLLEPKSTLPPPKPCQLPPPPSSEVEERLDWPVPSATATISPVSTLTMRALMATLALELEWPMPPTPKPCQLPPPPPTLFFLRFVAELGDGADDDDVNAGQLAEARGGGGIGALELEKFCSAMILSRAWRSIDGVGAVLDQVGDEQVGDALADVDVGAEDGGGVALHRGVVEVQDGDTGFARGSGLGAGRQYGQCGGEGQQNGQERKRISSGSLGRPQGEIDRTKKGRLLRPCSVKANRRLEAKSMCSPGRVAEAHCERGCGEDWQGRGRVSSGSRP